VGAHKGEDTAYYLSQGYRVIAIEADPTLAAGMTQRFMHEIRNGQCKVLDVGVAEKEGELPFYICEDGPVLNSFDYQWASRASKKIRQTMVRCRPFSSILAEYGVPYFLKVDIEGFDHLCIHALDKWDAPKFVSLETEPNSLEMILLLQQLGYTQFRLVDQYGFGAVSVPQPGSLAHLQWAAVQCARQFVRRHPQVQKLTTAVRPKVNFKRVTEGFATGSSGPPPWEKNSGWQEFDSFLHTWLGVLKSGVLTSSWFDIHAARV
jgi:FkbM family methyltransferase